MFERDASEPQGDAGTEASLDAFLFLGASLFFPGSLLRIVEQEAGCANAMRLDELRGLPEALVARNR